jgi:hypothetical protein
VRSSPTTERYPVLHIRRFACCVTALAALAVASAVQAIDPPAKARDTLSARLFPMAIGAKWVYASNDKDVTFEVLRTEKDKAAEVEVFVVRRTLGTSAVDFRLSVEEDGVYIHREGEKEFSPPLRQFAFFARTGDEWKWKGTFGGKKRTDHFEHLGAEEIKVPAGTFATFAVRRSELNTADHATYWLAKDVGVVRLSGKTELLDAPTAGTIVFEWRLKRYTPGNKKE